MTTRSNAAIFRGGSRTYFYSSLFFPAAERDDVFRLYAFVRVADDFVDQVPQDGTGFEAFVGRYRAALAGRPTGDPVVDGFVALALQRGFDPGWTESFLAAMRRDLKECSYASLADVEQYMYGSAEVIGLMMTRVLGLPDVAHPTARRLGKAMQYINFLRDVQQDEALGRTYIPQEVLRRHGLDGLSRDVALARPERFADMMRSEIGRYREWQAQAEAGYRYLPPRYRVPIQTAADMYAWTAREIERRPHVVYERQLKPALPRVIGRVARNALGAAWRSGQSGLAARLPRRRPWVG